MSESKLLLDSKLKYNKDHKKHYLDLMNLKAKEKYNKVINFAKDRKPTKGSCGHVQVLKRSQIHGAAQVKKMLEEQIRMQ